MADAFVQLAKFTNMYGALSNAQFINQLYVNVLDRMPDAPGLAHDLNLLNTTLTSYHSHIGGGAAAAGTAGEDESMRRTGILPGIFSGPWLFIGT